MNYTAYKYNENKGFTLPELIVTVAVIGIVLTVGIPSFRSTLINNRLSSQSNLLVSSFNLARSEATKRGQEVRLVPNDTSNWASGWTIVTDGNGDGDYIDDVDLLALGEALQGNSSLSPANGNSLTNNYVSFNSRGALQPRGDIFVFRLTDASCSGDQARLISVSSTGRTQVTRQSC